VCRLRCGFLGYNFIWFVAALKKTKLQAQAKCNHETKKCPNIERATSNERAKTKTHAKGQGRK